MNTDSYIPVSPSIAVMFNLLFACKKVGLTIFLTSLFGRHQDNTVFISRCSRT